MHTRSIGSALVGLTFVAATGALGAGCSQHASDAPPTPGSKTGSGVDGGPSTVQSPPGNTVTHTPPQKLDLLFSIDNSASMGDKQAYLEQAIPNLIQRLVTPNCIDAS